MDKIYLPLILFLLLTFQGIAFDLLPNFLVNGSTFIIAHWVFVVLILITLYYDQNQSYHAILYGIIFGLLIDIVYTEVLGVYMFTYATIIYLIHTLQKTINVNFYVTIVLGLIGIALVDASIYIIYSVVGLTNMLLGEYLFHRLLPTVLANIIFLIILYPVLKRVFVKWGNWHLSKRGAL